VGVRMTALAVAYLALSVLALVRAFVTAPCLEEG
jgi:hypothetical protein